MKNAVYEKVRKQIESEIITNFEEIAKEIGKHKLCDAVGMSFDTLVIRIADPGTYRIHELAVLADLISLEHRYLYAMADNLKKKQPIKSKKKGKK
jgi:hypothetical protein